MYTLSTIKRNYCNAKCALTFRVLNYSTIVNSVSSDELHPIALLFTSHCNCDVFVNQWLIYIPYPCTRSAVLQTLTRSPHLSVSVMV